MFSVHKDFECSNLRDRAFKCQTPTVEMRMTMQQDQIFKQNFFLIASSSLYNSAVLFGFACRVSSSKESEWCIATMQCPRRRPALTMHIVNFPSWHAPILLKHSCIENC